jgi:antitoxin CptB
MANDQSDSLAVRRRRVRFRCWHRGTREADLLLGRFADSCVGDLDQAGLGQLEALLDQPDPDIWDWVVGRQPVPEAFDNDVTRRLKELSTRLRSD